MNRLSFFNSIRTFIFDVDGVFTNSQILVTETGDLLRSMNTRDGMAVRMALDKNYQIIILSGGKSEGVRVRFSKLGVEKIILGAENKLDKAKKMIQDGIFTPETTVFMGDDVNDLELMNHLKNTACPLDADGEIIAVSKYVSPIKGGEGCVRELIEKTLRIQDNWI